MNSVRHFTCDREARHLTPEDRATMREMANRVDPEELICLLGAIIANDHPDADTGTKLRGQLLSVARQLKGDREWMKRDANA
jgi:hypothetical protein